MQQRIEQIAQIAAVILLVLGCLTVLRPFVTALLSAAFVGIASWPVYKYMEQRVGGRRTIAALVMTLLLIILFVLPLALIAANLADNATALADQVRDFLAGGLPPPPAWVSNLPLIGENIDSAWREVAASQEKLIQLLKRFMLPAQHAVLSMALIVGEGVVQLTLAALIGFFFYRDGEQLMISLRAALRRVAGDLAPSLMSTVGGTITGVIYGIIGTAIVQGAVATIGFLIAGVPGAWLLGFLTFLLSVLPIGPPLIWGAAAAWLAYHGQIGWAIFMAIWGLVVISGIDNVIKPLIISRGSSLPFILVFLGVIGGAIAFGFVGIFLGPTLLAVGYSLTREWTRPAPPDLLSR